MKATSALSDCSGWDRGTMNHGKGGAGGRDNKIYPQDMAGVNENGTQADIAGKAGSKRPILAPLPRVMQHGVEGVGGAMQPFNSVPARSFVAWDTAVAPDGLAHDDKSERINGMITGFQDLPSPHLDPNGAEHWKASSVLENASNLYASVISELRAQQEKILQGANHHRVAHPTNPGKTFSRTPCTEETPKIDDYPSIPGLGAQPAMLQNHYNPDLTEPNTNTVKILRTIAFKA